jgi:AAA+ ATPase superfamily predicted ATPase
MTVIQRKEAEELGQAPGWLLVYGRRKVGKTFLVKRILRWDVYFTVRRDLGVIVEGDSPVHDMHELCERVKNLLREGKTVVVDEFQRLPESFWDEVASVHPSGKLILLGSSLGVVHRIFGKGSPLLGLVREKKLGLISPSDALRFTLERFPPEKALLLAPYVREPWTVEFLREGEPIRVIYEILKGARHSIPALVGEIFTEEERQLTVTYEAILRLVGSGRWRSTEIASTLYGRGILKQADPRAIAPYVKHMEKMDLIESVEIWKSRAVYLKLRSPVMEAFYYLADRYAFDELEVSFEEVRPTLERLVSMHVQDFVSQLFAEREGGTRMYYFTPERELDFVITARGRPRLVGEVKLGKVDDRDLRRFEEGAAVFPDAEKVLVCNEEREWPGITVLTPEKLVGLKPVAYN